MNCFVFLTTGENNPLLLKVQEPILNQICYISMKNQRDLGYKITIHYIVVTKETLLENVKHRNQTSRRFVLPEIALSTFERLQDNLFHYMKVTDEFLIIKRKQE